MSTDRPVRVFISHATLDRGFVEGEIVSLLQSHGIETWFSTDSIRGADEWQRRIRAGLEGCDWFDDARRAARGDRAAREAGGRAGRGGAR